MFVSEVSQAFEKYKSNDFEGALSLYRRLEKKIGRDLFEVNIFLCEKNINKKKLSSDKNIDNIFEVLSDKELLLLLKDLSASSFSGREWANDLWSNIKNGKKEIAIQKITTAKSNKDFKNEFLIEISSLIRSCREAGLNKKVIDIFKRINHIFENKFILESVYWASYKDNDIKYAEFIFNIIKSKKYEYNFAEEWLIAAERRIKVDNNSLLSRIEENFKRKTKIKNSSRSKKKIAYFLHNSLPFSSGGYATRAHGMANGLKENNYEIMCVSRPGFPLDTVGDHNGKNIPEVDYIDGIEYKRILYPLRKGLSSDAYIFAAVQSIKDFLIANDIDIVLAASNHLTAIPAGLAAADLGLPYFYEVRGFWEVTRISREPEYEKTKQYAAQVALESVAAKYADAVFTLTTPMMEELVKRGIPKNKITILPNSCDPSRFTPRSRNIALAKKLNIPDDVPVIGYIGSFVQYEGLENLAHACAILLKRGIDFRLLLVGSENASGSEKGPITEEILRVANEEGLASKLIMPGRVPHEEVEAYYSLIDIAPFPRKPQPVCEMVSPMKPLEALAMEKAVLVSSVRALKEMIIENETGLIFEKGNIVDFSSKLEILLKDKILRHKLGKAGRKWVESERSWAKTSLAAKSVIEKFLDK